MCHRGHQADTDPLADPGAKDITAHVNFSAVALAAQDAGLQVLGYTSQARFLLNCGLPALMAAADARSRPQAQPLMLEHEMGELFKVIGLAAGERLRRRRLRRRRPLAHAVAGPRMRWLLVFLIAFLLFNGLQGWLRRLGLGRCRATCTFAWRPRVVPAAGQQPGAEPAGRCRGDAAVRRIALQWRHLRLPVLHRPVRSLAEQRGSACRGRYLVPGDPGRRRVAHRARDQALPFRVGRDPPATWPKPPWA
jgi:hypothetical protein